MQQPFAKAAQSGGALCEVPITVAPFFAEKSEATLRAIVHGSSFQAPSAQPSESHQPPFHFMDDVLREVLEIERAGEMGELVRESRIGHRKVKLQSGDEIVGGKAAQGSRFAVQRARAFIRAGPMLPSVGRSRRYSGGCAPAKRRRQHDRSFSSVLVRAIRG